MVYESMSAIFLKEDSKHLTTLRAAPHFPCISFRENVFYGQLVVNATRLKQKARVAREERVQKQKFKNQF